MVVVALKPARLAVRWRTEETRFELRNGFLGVDRLASDIPTILLGDIESDGRVVEAFLDRPDLRSGLAICDLGRLERLGTVRSSTFVSLSGSCATHMESSSYPLRPSRGVSSIK